MAKLSVSTSKLRGCSGNSFNASRMTRLATQNSPSPSLSVRAMVLLMMLSLSLAVIVISPLATWNRKLSRIGREFLLPITLASILSLLLNAELETVNLMSRYFILLIFYITYLIFIADAPYLTGKLGHLRNYEHKNTKNIGDRQK